MRINKVLVVCERQRAVEDVDELVDGCFDVPLLINEIEASKEMDK
jgi:hypothetical protein